MSSSSVDVLVIGGGPTGLGAAARLHQHGHKSWKLIDAFKEAGGLACTDVTPEGFLFDMGGHVIFSHFHYFDQLIDAAVGTGDGSWNTLERVSYVWIKDRWVPYPFQNNLYNLDLEDQIDCINGVIEATKESAKARPEDKPKNFDEWIIRVMGKGIADIFMRPYNFKVWATPTHLMQCDWLGERVATVDAKTVVENVLRQRPAVGWGPNAVFRFPKEGGTGGIWTRVADKCVPKDKQEYNKRCIALDLDSKTATFDDGSKMTYNKLLSTMSLDLTLQMVGRADLAEGLHYSSTHVVGLGIRGINPHDTKCWLYYPEDNCPFYRCTVFSLYAEKNCPPTEKPLPTLRYGRKDKPVEAGSRPGPYWSLMFEVAESKYKPVPDDMIEETIIGALNTKMMSEDHEIVSIYYRRLERGYPTPNLQREGALEKALPFLQSKDVWSRGRFGSWRYEVANQDHSCMIGVEAVDNMLFGTQEFTLNFPNRANATKNKDLVYKLPE
jgi:protoporphyrinogen oxidase